jgi:hypothetical protein
MRARRRHRSAAPPGLRKIDATPLRDGIMYPIMFPMKTTTTIAVGMVVQVRLGGKLAYGGRVEYLDGDVVGIRDLRLGGVWEAWIETVEVDPT